MKWNTSMSSSEPATADSLAGDMVLRGTKVSAIYDKNPAPIRDIQAAGGIKMSGPVVQGFAPIDHPTESLEDAMAAGQRFPGNNRRQFPSGSCKRDGAVCP